MHIHSHLISLSCLLMVSLYLGSNPNDLTVTNSVTYNEVDKGVEGIPHEATNTEEPYAAFNKTVSQDTNNEPSALYAYATVDTQKVRNFIIVYAMYVPYEAMYGSHSYTANHGHG